MNNVVLASWGGAITDDYFTDLSGVKQGALLSSILYCVYVDDLLLILSKAGVGCFIGLHFVGALTYTRMTPSIGTYRFCDAQTYRYM